MAEPSALLWGNRDGPGNEKNYNFTMDRDHQLGISSCFPDRMDLRRTLRSYHVRHPDGTRDPVASFVSDLRIRRLAFVLLRKKNLQKNPGDLTAYGSHLRNFRIYMQLRAGRIFPFISLELRGMDRQYQPPYFPVAKKLYKA